MVRHWHRLAENIEGAPTFSATKGQRWRHRGGGACPSQPTMWSGGASSDGMKLQPISHLRFCFHGANESILRQKCVKYAEIKSFDRALSRIMPGWMGPRAKVQGGSSRHLHAKMC